MKDIVLCYHLFRQTKTDRPGKNNHLKREKISLQETSPILPEDHVI